MKKLLYLVKSRTADLELIPTDAPDLDIAIILLQDGTGISAPLPGRVSILADDEGSLGSDPARYPRVNYGDLVQLMFEADTVITL